MTVIRLTTPLPTERSMIEAEDTLTLMRFAAMKHDDFKSADRIDALTVAIDAVKEFRGAMAERDGGRVPA